VLSPGEEPGRGFERRSAYMRMLLTILVAVSLACGAAASALIISAPVGHYDSGYADGQS
jgi:hypothetical protein